MSFLVWKLDDFVLDRRAVARAGGVNLSAVHGRTMDVLADDAVGFRRGVGDVAGDLGLRDFASAKAEGRRVGVAMLDLKA